MLREMPHRVLALVAVVLLVGAMFCLFDANNDAQLDLCNLLLLPVAALALGAPRVLVGRVVLVPIRMDPRAPADPPFPPPRS